MTLKCKANIHKYGVAPSLGFSSSILAPFVGKWLSLFINAVDGNFNLASKALSFGFKKEQNNDSLSYSCHVNLSKQTFSISPSISYQISPEISFTAQSSITHTGLIS